MKYVKVTGGYVRQAFDNDVYTGQEFVATGTVHYENVRGWKSYKCPQPVTEYHPFDMVQPDLFAIRTDDGGPVTYFCAKDDTTNWTCSVADATLFTKRVAEMLLSIFDLLLCKCAIVCVTGKEDD